MITQEDKSTARFCLEEALAKSASAVRVSFSRNSMDSISFLNGELDKVTRSSDCSVFFHLFVDGRYGTFSTNRLERSELSSFLDKAIDTVRMFAPDECRCLPDISITAQGEAVTGMEMDLYDSAYGEISLERKLETIESECIWNRSELAGAILPSGCSIISEECEWSDSLDDNYLIDSNGLEATHTETSYCICSEITVNDGNDGKVSGYWWDSSVKYDSLGKGKVSLEALRRACAQINPQSTESLRATMVVENNAASRLIAPILNALQASAVQQHNSFLSGCIGKKVFAEGFTLLDKPRQKGCAGSRLFDTEGVATKDMVLIEDGVVRNYFVNTYMSKKMGLQPTIEGISRPVLNAFPMEMDKNEISLQDVLGLCGRGILVTGFNGGNCNSATGDFSYGVEGFIFENGRIVHPVREMVITGNIISLWSSLRAVATDGRKCSRWAIPTLAFDNVDFSS